MSSIPKSLQARRRGKDNRHGIFQEHGLSPSASVDRTRFVPALALLVLVGMRSFFFEESEALYWLLGIAVPIHVR